MKSRSLSGNNYNAHLDSDSTLYLRVNGRNNNISRIVSGNSTMRPPETPGYVIFLASPATCYFYASSLHGIDFQGLSSAAKGFGITYICLGFPVGHCFSCTHTRLPMTRSSKTRHYRRNKTTLHACKSPARSL